MAPPKKIEIKNKHPTKVHSDINLELWNIFATKHRRGPRTITRQTVLPDGTKEVRSVTIETHPGQPTLTATDAKIFYLLLKLWQDQGQKEDGLARTSLHRLFSALIDTDSVGQVPKTRRGNWSKTWIESKLKKMIVTPIVYEQSYKNKDGSYRQVHRFNLLKAAEIFERKTVQPQQKFFDFSWVKIDDDIVKAVLEKNTKPVRADVLLSFRKEIAVLLYRFLDPILFDKSQYERNIEDLSRELDFQATQRKNLLKTLREACAELEGKDLSTGRIDSCRIEKTADGRNWKLVAVKGRQRPAFPAVETSVSATTHDPTDAEEAELMAIFDGLSPEEKQKIQTDADEIFRTKYRMGGELTHRYAVLDALRERSAHVEKAQ